MALSDLKNQLQQIISTSVERKKEYAEVLLNAVNGVEAHPTSLMLFKTNVRKVILLLEKEKNSADMKSICQELLKHK